MTEQQLIITELKYALRERGLTYTAVAKHLHLSLASVKRLFSTGNLSLRRVEQICELLGVRLFDILERGNGRASALTQLTLAQEQQIVADPKLFFITWMTLNRAPVEEIARDFLFNEREVFKYLVRLDKLKVIELLPGSRTKLLVSRHFSWRPDGPVQRYIHQKLLREFLSARFDGGREEFFFNGAAVSDAALLELKNALRNTARQCSDIIERDKAPRGRRRGAAFVLALRPWIFSGFGQLERPSAAAR
jgi:DNA-binding Xre family transcriptional regulator